jgi:hypothetical protein
MGHYARAARTNDPPTSSAVPRKAAPARPLTAPTAQPVWTQWSPGVGAAPGLLAPGERLPDGLRSRFEQRFDHDFSRVRVHTDARADASARTFDANAFTSGYDIVFRRGEYDPGTTAGSKLLAHELTHVVQQGAGVRFGGCVSQPSDAAEAEADRTAEAVSAGKHAGSVRATPSAVARQPAPKQSPTYIEFEIDPGGPPGQINAHFTGPTDNANWVDRAITAAAYTIWLNGFMLYVGSMTPGGPGIVVPESDVDFTIERATPINKITYDSRAEAMAAVAAAPKPADGSRPFAYYWGAGGLVVVPTTICPGSAPRTAATMWGARVDYANYVQRGLVNLALGMLGGKILGSAYGWARAGGGGGVKLPARSFVPESGGGPGKLSPEVRPAVKAQVKPSTVAVPEVKPPTVETPKVEPPTAKSPTAEAPEALKPEAPQATAKAPAEANAPQSGPELFTRTAQAPGGQAEKAKFFETHAQGLRQRTGWEANYTGQTPDGARVYHGEAQSKALVITSDGRVMTGSWGQHVKIQPSATGPQLVCDWNLPGWKQW